MLNQNYKLSLLDEDELGEEEGEVKTSLDPLAGEEDEEEGEEKPVEGEPGI